MRLASYVERGGASATTAFGAVVGAHVVKLSTPETPTLRQALALEGIEGLARRLAVKDASTGVLLAQVELLPPIPDPDKILCIGLNYRLHAEEAGMAIPDHPSVFTRYPSSLLAHEQAVQRPPESTRFDYEAELAVVIGRRARRIGTQRAMEVIAGYACLAENSVRDWQRHSNQATPGKNFVGSGAFGPWLTTPDEAGPPEALRVIGRLNGEVVQDDTVAQMIFSIPELIAYLSVFTELLPGDVIATGTPAGVGMSRHPPRFLRSGDVFEVEVPGVGLLRNAVIDEPSQ